MKRDLFDALLRFIILMGLGLIIIVVISSCTVSPRAFAWGHWCAHLFEHTWILYVVSLVMEVILGVIPKKAIK